MTYNFAKLSIDCSAAYCHFVDLYTCFTAMPSDEFEIFTDNTNTASVVLQAHFLALEALIRPWLLSEFDRKYGDGQRNAVTVLPQSAGLVDDLPSTTLLSWPLKVLQTDHGSLSPAKSADTAP